MKKIIALTALAGLLAGCDTPEETAALGMATGAVLGAAIADKHEGKGAAAGAAVGLAAGAAVGAARQGPQCRYVYPDGREVIAPCP